MKATANKNKGVGTKAQVGILGLGPYLVMWIHPRISK